MVFQPAKMSASKLQDLYHYAWERFYSDCSQNLKMAKLFMKVIDKEKADNTYRHHNLRRGRWAEGREKAGIE